MINELHFNLPDPCWLSGDIALVAYLNYPHSREFQSHCKYPVYAMGLESLKNLPVFHEQNFKNYVPYRLSSQPRITYINTKPRTPSTSHAPQQRSNPTDEDNQKRGHSEQALMSIVLRTTISALHQANNGSWTRSVYAHFTCNNPVPLYKLLFYVLSCCFLWFLC